MNGDLGCVQVAALASNPFWVQIGAAKNGKKAKNSCTSNMLRLSAVKLTQSLNYRNEHFMSGY
jgi:hypothetical protein